MLQDHILDNRSLAVNPLPTLQTDFEKTLLFHPATGNFTFGPETLDSGGVFRIKLTAAQKIIINAGPGIAFTPETPFKKLPFNNSGSFSHSLINPTRIEIDVTALPSIEGILGFVLIVQFTDGSSSVGRIQTPPFFITPDQPFPEPDVKLHYTPETGVFELLENGTKISGSITLEKGLVLFRFHDGSAPPSSTIHVSLTSDGMIFAHQNAAVLNPASGASFTRDSDTEITITRAFTPDTGFCVSFGVHLTDQNCTVYSPDPIIIDKQIGTGGE